MHADPSYTTYLAEIDLEAFDKRVAAFWHNPPHNEADAFQRLLEVLEVGADGRDGTRAAYVTETATYPAGQTMWRARIVPLQDQPVLPDLHHESDLWEAPTKFVQSRGRLNAVGESILYTSIGDAVAAMVEARVPTGEKFALIRYETKRPITLARIGSDTRPDWLPRELEAAHARVTNFIKDVFTREFDGRNQLTYMLSNRIGKDWFDLPPAIVDGWLFASIAHRKGINAAFRPEKAHDAIRVTGVAYGEAINSGIMGLRMQARIFSPGYEAVHGGFRWFAMGSPQQAFLFPEFR